MLTHLRGLDLAYGDKPLLDNAEFLIQPGERVALVGRNGAGKSTLMRIIAGEVAPDAVQREDKSGLIVSRLRQEVPADLTGPVYDIVAAGLGDLGAALSRFHSLAARLSAGEDVSGEMAKAQGRIEAADGWTLGNRVETILSQLKLGADWLFESLSGGLKRRVLLAQALVQSPDLLLLDEPTNHLDIKAISQLEQIMRDWPGALLFITHDRALLKALATRIVDLDRGKLHSYPGDYDRYLIEKDKALEVEAKENAAFDKKLAQEEAWIRQGIKARRTRNEGRVRALKAMRKERQQRREQQGKAALKSHEISRSGKRVVRATDVTFYWQDKPIIKNLNTRIERGDKVGIIGPNGSGKTTLINLLLGKLEPHSGEIKLGTNLEIAHFDQHRAGIDMSLNVMDNVASGRTSITINGKSQHIISYLQDFLFSPERARAPVTRLSGGEKNRLLLAKLFTKPANLLVMDEPTNDLDIETLELLEERLIEYNGTLLLVSHDRAFINNVVTNTLVFEGEGQVNEYIGGYDDWLRQRPQQPAQTKTTAPTKAKASQKTTLTRAEQRELHNLPNKIEKAEETIEQLEAQMTTAGFYDQPQNKIAAVTQQLTQTRQKLEELMLRWEQLEERF